jgi:hypothetical protein
LKHRIPQQAFPVASWKRKKKRCDVPRKAMFAHWLSANAGRDSTMYAIVSGLKGPNVVVAGAEGVVGGAEVD